MQIVLFYPITSKKDYSMLHFTFEPGGFFVKKDGELYYNKSIFSMELDSKNSAIRHVEHYKFINKKGVSINITPSEFNDGKSNLKDIVINYMNESKNTMSEKESLKFGLELDSLCKNNMIDYALASNNKELFLKLTDKQEQHTT